MDDTDYTFVCVVNGVEYRKRKRSPSTTTSTAKEDSHREKRVSTTKSKETLEQIQFREFMNQLEIVLLELDPHPPLWIVD